MSERLPPHLMRLFAPREPVLFVQPEEHATHGGYSGVAEYLAQFESAEDDRAAREAAAAKTHEPTPTERRLARVQQRMAENNARIAQQLEQWNPKACTPEKDGVTQDPYRTLFLYRLVCCLPPLLPLPLCSSSRECEVRCADKQRG